jgi:hypothetical protein
MEGVSDRIASADAELYRFIAALKPYRLADLSP